MELADLLDLLRSKGVVRFENAELKIELAPVVPQETTMPIAQSFTREAPKSMWDHPSLWPSGEPPKFPK